MFQRALDLLNTASGLRVSFDDFTGFTLDFPQLFLPLTHSIHGCSTCMQAKATMRGQQDCALNKHASNRITINRRQGFAGLCHLGLLDIVEPLIFKGSILGVFYYGSVVIQEREVESRNRVLRYCRRRKLDPSPYLKAWSEAPRTSESEIALHRDRLRLIAESVCLWCEALAVPVEHYPRLEDNVYWILRRSMPPLIRAAMKFVALRYSQTCRVSDIADYIGCHPNYLSHEFKRHTGENLADYIEDVRIERAKSMLRGGQLSVGEITFRCGFADPSHFIRVFRRRIGLTPKSYQAKLAVLDKDSQKS